LDNVGLVSHAQEKRNLQRRPKASCPIMVPDLSRTIRPFVDGSSFLDSGDVRDESSSEQIPKFFDDDLGGLRRMPQSL
jgi:hypothetical protein